MASAEVAGSQDECLHKHVGLSNQASERRHNNIIPVYRTYVPLPSQEAARMHVGRHQTAGGLQREMPSHFTANAQTPETQAFQARCVFDDYLPEHD